MYIGDLLFQIVTFLIIVFVFYLLYRMFFNIQQPKNTQEMNEKLDRIIELLEKEENRK